MHQNHIDITQGHNKKNKVLGMPKGLADTWTQPRGLKV